MEWRQTASLIAATLEPHRNRESHPEPFTADEFDPFERRSRGTVVPASIECLKMFVPQG